MEDIYKMSLEDLKKLNEKVVHRINFLRARKARDIINRFQVGQSVEFTNRDGTVVGGKVLKVNRTTVDINPSDGLRGYRVHASAVRVA